eukprot:403374962
MQLANKSYSNICAWEFSMPCDSNKQLNIVFGKARSFSLPDFSCSDYLKHSRDQFPRKCESQNLSLQEKTHSSHTLDEESECRFTCKIDNCQKSFARANRLEMHKRTKHFGQDLHKCTFKDCQKIFAEKGNLLVHMRVHTGDKPFKCAFCEKTFTSIGNCKDHERRHNNVNQTEKENFSVLNY